MTPLTIHLLTKNNEDTIEQTVSSLAGLNAHILVADLGSRDNTLNLCNGLKVTKVSFNGDYSAVRNEVVKRTETDWQMYVEPWEMLVSGHEKILEIVAENAQKAYFVDILQGDVITKQIRLWRKSDKKKFTNPVFEKIIDEGAVHSEAVIWTERSVLQDESLIEQWKKSNPLATDPYYYQACACLRNKKYKEFLTLADYYLFQEKRQSVSKTMTRYYLGMIHCLVTNDQNSAIKNAMLCIAEHPLMAEFWCLLGDAYLKSNEFEKAIAFYENGIILGSRRLRTDRWPMHISKYEDYPREMIRSCKEIIAKTQDFGAKKHQVR